jgi:uncharacterized protein (DUF983 family)
MTPSGPRSSPPARTTESALTMPSVGRVIRVAWRVGTLRCPNCGGGWVLKSFNVVHEHCSACGFRFCRSDDDYFSGAMFFGILIGEGLAVLGIFAVTMMTWPDVPWTLLQYGGPIVLLVVMIGVFPLSRLVWLGIDVLVRPVETHEFVDTPSLDAISIAIAR